MVASILQFASTCLIIGFFVWLVYYLRPTLIQYLNIREAEARTKREHLFMTLSPQEIQKEIDEYIDGYMNIYILYHFTGQDRYIGEKEANEMITSITRTIYLHLSDLYRFYINQIRNIDDDNDLLVFLKDNVKERALLYISESNKPI